MQNRILSGMGKWYAEFDENGTCVKAVYDDAYLNLLGIESEKDASDSKNDWKAIVHPDDIERIEANAADLFAKHPEGMDYDLEYRMMTPSGYHWFHDYGLCTRREDGSVRRMDGVIFDVQDVVDGQNLHRSTAENYSRILALEDDFEVLYDVELDTGHYDIFVKGQTFGDVNNNLVNNNSFFDDVEKNLNVVHPEDRQGNYDTTRPGFIRDALSKDDHFDRYYRLMVDGQPAWARMRIVYKNAEKTNIIIGVFNAENDVEAKQIAEQKEQLEAQQKVLRENMQMLAGLADRYETLYYVNLGEGSFKIYALDGEKYPQTSQIVNNQADGFEALKQFGSSPIVHPDDRCLFENLGIESVKERLAHSKKFSIRYRQADSVGDYVWFEMEVIKYEEIDEPANVIAVGFANRDAEIREEQEQQAKLEESLSFTDYFLNTYVSAFYIDLMTRKFTTYKEPPSEQGRALSKQTDYLQTLSGYFRKVVHPDDVDELISFIQPQRIRELVRNGDFSFFFRDISTDPERIIRMQIIRGADGDHAALGFTDITEDYKEQQSRLLGAMPLSNDVLSKANIGMWAFELDEGQPPRMYDDETMLGLVGLDHQVPPEEAYHAWYDHIDEDSYDLVTDAVNKMISGEHAEVQYPWHYPDGRTIIVRCGGVRNYGYTKGIRIEGTHQNVTQTLHFDEEERQRAKQIENDLIISKLRADSLAYIADNEPDLDNALAFFGKQILDIFKCDQVVYRELEGRKVVLNAPGMKEVPEEICSKCPFARFDCHAFDEDGTVLMDDCRLGYRGIMAPADCPAKSSFMQMIYSGGKLVGKLTVHFLNQYHTFSENAISVMKVVAVYLGLMIGRINERKAEIARIEAEGSSKAKTEFLFNMSHDIRTPMNAIIGFTDQAIKHQNEPEQLNTALGKVKDSSEYLLRIVNDILDMAKIESGNLELKEEFHHVEVGENALINVFGADAARKGIEFHTSYDLHDTDFWMDVSRVNQIGANLISNAIKYTQPGGEIWYSVQQIPSTHVGYGRFVIRVKDTGCGMSQEFLSKIFNAFERDTSAKQSGAQGTGLGMAIVKKLVDAMSGTIEIESEPGVGTTVSITLDHRIATPEEIERYRNETSIGADAYFSYKGKKALLVEDNVLNREIATDILNEEGILVEEADDGAKAVEMLKEKGPAYYDFVLMDIQMPTMNGYEATKAIRTMYPDSKLPIIALSANAFSEDKQRSIEAGMDDHVAKPINMKELFAVLSKYL